MKLTILSQYYPPEVGAPQARLSDLARRFRARGHDVSIVTAMPNYPGGRVHDGYGGLLRREMRDDMPVIRTFVYPSQSPALVPRLASYGSFAASSAVLALPFLRRSDFLMVESPPLFLGPTGWWLSLVTRARLIFNVSDLWPESAVHVGVLRRESRAFRAAARLEAFCYRRAWLVTGQSRTIVDDIQARFPAQRTFHLSGGVDTTRFRPDAGGRSARQVLGGEGGTVVLYAGLHGIAQGLSQLLEAALRLRQLPGLRFVLIGDGPEKRDLMARATSQGLTNVTFLPSMPHGDMPGVLASADIIAVSLRSAIPGAVPSKLYEAMASGRPVAFVGSGEAAEIVRSGGAGVVVAPGEVAALERSLRLLAADTTRAKTLGENGRRVAVEQFDRGRISARFIDYLEAA